MNKKMANEKILILILLSLLIISGCSTKKNIDEADTTIIKEPKETETEVEIVEDEPIEETDGSAVPDTGYNISGGERAEPLYQDTMSNPRCFDGNKFEIEVNNIFDKTVNLEDNVVLYIRGWPHQYRFFDCEKSVLEAKESTVCVVTSPRAVGETGNKLALFMEEQKGSDYIVDCPK